MTNENNENFKCKYNKNDVTNNIIERLFNNILNGIEGLSSMMKIVFNVLLLVLVILNSRAISDLSDNGQKWLSEKFEEVNKVVLDTAEKKQAKIELLDESVMAFAKLLYAFDHIQKHLDDNLEKPTAIEEVKETKPRSDKIIDIRDYMVNTPVGTKCFQAGFSQCSNQDKESIDSYMMKNSMLALEILANNAFTEIEADFKAKGSSPLVPKDINWKSLSVPYKTLYCVLYACYDFTARGAGIGQLPIKDALELNLDYKGSINRVLSDLDIISEAIQRKLDKVENNEDIMLI